MARAQATRAARWRRDSGAALKEHAAVQSSMELTEDNDIENQDDKAKDTSAGAIRPGVVNGSGSNNGRSSRESGPAKLEKEGGDDGLHVSCLITH
jgi:hypothetical protein